MATYAGAFDREIKPCPDFAVKALDYAASRLDEKISLEDLARAVGMSRFGFCRRFSQEYGVSPMRWLWGLRAALAAEMLLAAPSWTLTEVAFSCGFTSSAHFSRAFKSRFKVTPSAFRKTAGTGGANLRAEKAEGHFFEPQRRGGSAWLRAAAVAVVSATPHIGMHRQKMPILSA